MQAKGFRGEREGLIRGKGVRKLQVAEWRFGKGWGLFEGGVLEARLSGEERGSKKSDKLNKIMVGLTEH